MPGISHPLVSPFPPPSRPPRIPRAASSCYVRLSLTPSCPPSVLPIPRGRCLSRSFYTDNQTDRYILVCYRFDSTLSCRVHPHTRAKFTSCMLQRRRSRCRPTAAALTRSLLNPLATHPPPANLLSHSSVSTPPPLNPPSKQPSIITKAPARYIRIAPIHPPSKGLISALPLKLVLPQSPPRKRRPD